MAGVSHPGRRTDPPVRHPPVRRGPGGMPARPAPRRRRHRPLSWPASGRRVARTESAGTAHLAQLSDTRSTLASTSAQRVSTVDLTIDGDIRFVGPDLSLTTTSRSTLPTSSPTPGTPSTTTTTTSSRSIYLGGHLYVGVPPGPVWNALPVRSPFAYLGLVPTRFLEYGPGSRHGCGTPGDRRAGGHGVPRPRAVLGSQSIHLSDSHNHSYTARFTTSPFTLAVWLDGSGRIVRTSGTGTSPRRPARQGGHGNPRPSTLSALRSSPSTSSPRSWRRPADVRPDDRTTVWAWAHWATRCCGSTG